jgi:hypothetical protein
MTDFPAENAGASGGTALTERAGAASGDTVPTGCIVLMRNTGAGSHDVTFTNNATQDGLTVSNRTVTMATTVIKAVFIPAYLGDANGRVAMAVANATPTELKYYILGGF